MTHGIVKGFIVAAAVAAIHAGADASPLTLRSMSMSTHLSTIRIEETRPGGIPGAPRESSPFRQWDGGGAASTTPVLKQRRQRH